MRYLIQYYLLAVFVLIMINVYEILTGCLFCKRARYKNREFIKTFKFSEAREHVAYKQQLNRQGND